RSRTGLDNALENPHLKKEIEKRYPAPEHDLDHIRNGAKHNRGPKMASYNEAFHQAYGDRAEALRAVTEDMTARDRAEFDIELVEEEQSSGHFRDIHFARKGTEDTKSHNYAKEKAEKEKAR